MNEEKFDGKAALYAAARPDYPKELFETLREKSVFSPDTVCADIGSGTGIFTRALCPYVKKIWAVEPNRDMREKAEKAFCGKETIVSINGNAENTTLPDGSVSLVTAAQAFHWFCRSAFRAECRRILTQSGTVVLLWNVRKESSPLVAENLSLNKRLFGKSCGAESAGTKPLSDFSDFFEGDYSSFSFENPLYYTEETFLLRCLSSSFAPKENDALYGLYMEELHSLFSRYEKDRLVSYPYETKVYVGKV